MRSRARARGHGASPDPPKGTVGRRAFRRLRRGDVVEILWRDSESLEIGWDEPSRYMKAARRNAGYRTSGYYLGSSGDVVVIVLSVNPETRKVATAWAIPTAAVLSVQRLGRAHRRTWRALS